MSVDYVGKTIFLSVTMLEMSLGVLVLSWGVGTGSATRLQLSYKTAKTNL